MLIKTWGLTGFDDEYEATTQLMLWNAVRFLTEHKDATVESKQLDTAMKEGVKIHNGIQIFYNNALNHALYVVTHGYTAWLQTIAQYHPSDEPFQFNYPVDFVLPEPGGHK